MNAIRHLPLRKSFNPSGVNWPVASDAGEIQKARLMAGIVFLAILVDAAAIVILIGFAVGVIAANL